ncbi:unnamed protein product, partial [marine sediment metagenome]
EATTISGVLYNAWDVTGAFTANTVAADAGVSGTTATFTGELDMTGASALIDQGRI